MRAFTPSADGVKPRAEPSIGSPWQPDPAMFCVRVRGAPERHVGHGRRREAAERYGTLRRVSGAGYARPDGPRRRGGSACVAPTAASEPFRCAGTTRGLRALFGQDARTLSRTLVTWRGGKGAIATTEPASCRVPSRSSRLETE